MLNEPLTGPKCVQQKKCHFQIIGKRFASHFNILKRINWYQEKGPAKPAKHQSIKHEYSINEGIRHRQNLRTQEIFLGP